MKFSWIKRSNSVDPIDRQICVSRKIDDEFFSDSWDSIPSFKLMKDIDKAAQRILDAVRKKEKIFIFGHDDLDGITSTYIVFKFLEEIGSQNHYYYIPNRHVDNHGLQHNFIEKAVAEKADLILTVDGGTGSNEAVDFLNKQGIDVIITDHHIVPEELPNAYAVVNPKREDCDYPFTMLAGVGVAYFLLEAISEKINHQVNPSYLVWAAIGSYADKVPMIGVNRAMLRVVLENWENWQDRTLTKLKNYCNYDNNNFSIFTFISFIIRLFSNGRDINGEHQALRYLLNASHDRKAILSQLNREKHVFEKLQHELFNWLDTNIPNKINTHFLFYDKNNEISYEVLGMAAGLIAAKFKIPAILLRDKNDAIVCEARCTNGFNLVESFHYAKESLIQYGGHVRAAGFTMEKENLPRFCTLFEEYIELQKKEIINNKTIDIDAIVDLKTIAAIDFTILERFQPFGMENREPVILVEKTTIEDLSLGFYIQNVPPKFPRNEVQDLVFRFKTPQVLQLLDAELII